MEQKLFIIGIIALAYYLLSKHLIKNGLLKIKKNLLVWNIFSMALFSFVIAVVFSVIIQNSGTGKELGGSFWLFCVLLTTGAILFAVYQLKTSNTKKALDKIIHSNMDWLNTIYFAAILASIVMFFFIQAFKLLNICSLL